MSTPDRIPDEAVEAVAKYMADAIGSRPSPRFVRSILSVAAPHMLGEVRAEASADALEEAANLIEPFSGIGMSNGATRGDVARWLRARAKAMRTP